MGFYGSFRPSFRGDFRKQAGRIAAFYFLLSIPVLGWASLVLPYYTAHETITLNIIQLLVGSSPVVAGDLSLFGEITPALIAGGIIAIMPTSSYSVKVIAVAIAVITYLLYIHLNIFLSGDVGEGLLSAVWFDHDKQRTTLQTIVSNVRTMSIVTGAAILGYKINTTTQPIHAHTTTQPAVSP
jgi:hypothetical protein